MPDFAAPGDSLDAARGLALDHLCAWLDAQADAVTGRYPQVERESWPQQEAAAKAISEGNASPDEMAFLNGLKGADPLASFAQKVTTKATQFRGIVQIIKAVRSGAETTIAAATTKTAIAQAVTDAKTAFANMTGAS